MDYTKDIRSLLGEAAAFYPAIYYQAAVDSTNNRVKRLALEGAPEGTLSCADAQTAGRGRSGRTWVSPGGENIYCSLLLRPSFPPRLAAGLTLAMGLSVTEALREMGLPALIKWPNDAVADGKKLSGILTELTMTPDGGYFVVVGTGINVNQTAFAEEISKRATSLRLALGEGGAPAAPLDRRLVLARVLKRFAGHYAAYSRTGDLTGLMPAYHALLVNRGRQVRIEDPRGSFLAVARGIDAAGALLVEKEDGTVAAVSSGEVSVRGIYGYV